MRGITRLFRFPSRTRQDVHDEIHEELQFHLETRIEELIGLGLSEEAARTQATRELGDRAGGASVRAASGSNRATPPIHAACRRSPPGWIAGVTSHRTEPWLRRRGHPDPCRRRRREHCDLLGRERAPLQVAAGGCPGNTGARASWGKPDVLGELSGHPGAH